MLKPETIAKRRGRILAAASGLFAELAYPEVHMDEVAARAGIGKPTLYRYFATKEALFLAVLERSLADLAEAVGRLSELEGSRETLLRRAMALIFAEIGPLAPAIQAVEGQGAALSEQSRRALRAGFRALREKLARLLEAGVAAGEFRPFDSRVAALAIVGAARMAALVGADRAAAAATVPDLILGGLLRARPDPPLRDGVRLSLGA